MTQIELRSSERGLAVVAVVAIVAVVFVLLFVAAGWFASGQIDRVRRGWDDSIGSWEEIVERYPAVSANTAALEVESLAAELGLDLVPRHIDERERPTEEQTADFDALRERVFGRYAVKQIQRVSRGSIEPAPPELLAYLERHSDSLAALRRQLIDGETPMWESDLAAGWEAPLPNLLGQINLHKLLVNAAIERAHAGDSDGALRNLEASWRLNESLRTSPALICQLIRIAAARMQVGALRYVPEVPESWIARLAAADHRSSFIEAMQYEGRMWIDPGAENLGDEWWHRVARPATKPYVRVCLADASERWRLRLARLQSVDALCDYHLPAHGADLEIELPRWNRLGGSVAPNLSNATDRVARLEVDIELTLLLLDRDQARRSDPEGWPGELPDEIVSAACPRDRWLVAGTDRGVEVALSREVEWPGQMGSILPQRAITD